MAPVRSSCWLILPKDDNILIAILSSGISNEKINAGFFMVMAAYSAILIPKTVFPIDGRPATMIRSPACNPDVILSKSLNPVARPVIAPFCLDNSSILAVVAGRISWTKRGPLFERRWSLRPKISLSAISRRSSGEVSPGFLAWSTTFWQTPINWRETARSFTIDK